MASLALLVVVGARPAAADPLDCSGDCAGGEVSLAGVALELFDDDCDGLWEAYRCDGGPSVPIGPGQSTVDCAVRIVNGTAGADRINLHGTPGPSVIAGGGSADDIKGSDGDDLIVTGGGDDHAVGEDGNDTLCGGGGNDSLDGRRGDDVLAGGNGRDRLRGRQGQDLLLGGSGADLLRGDGDDDLLVSGDGDDVVRGGSGRDFLDCGSGDDLCNGERDDDSIFGGPGEDLCKGKDGNDFIDPGPGEDLVDAYRGNDVIDACDMSVDLIDGSHDLDTAIVRVMGDPNGVDIVHRVEVIQACLPDGRTLFGHLAGGGVSGASPAGGGAARLGGALMGQPAGKVTAAGGQTLQGGFWAAH